MMDIFSNLTHNLYQSHGYISWNDSTLRDSAAFSALGNTAKLLLVSDVGMTFSVLCVIDGVSGANATERLSDAAQEIHSVCPRNAFGIRSANLIIVEPEGSIPLPKLELKARGLNVTHLKINPNTGEASHSGGSLILGSTFSKLLTKAASTTPRPSSHDPRSRLTIALDETTPTPLSWALCGILCLVFLMSLIVGSHEWTNFTPQGLIALGGAYQGLVFPVDGSAPEYGRLLTASLLHGDLLHLLFNLWALYLVGPTLERMVGSCWLFVLFSLSAIAGSLASVFFNEPNIVSVGASGAICGVMAAAYAVTSRLGNPRDRIRYQSFIAQALVPSLLPAASSGIDIAAHIGGAATGALLSVSLLATWRPSWGFAPRRVGCFGAMLCGLLYAYSLGESASRFEEHKMRIAAKSVEQEALKEYSAAINRKDIAAAEKVITTLLAAYPSSQEGRYRKAYLLWLKNQYSAAISILAPLHQETPNDTYVLYLYAESLSQVDRPKEAAPLFDSLLELAEDRPYYYYSDAAYTHFKLGQYERAYKIADTGLALHPNTERLKFLRAISMTRPEQRGESLRELEALHSVSPTNTIYLYFLTTTALKAKQITRAKEYATKYQEAIKKQKQARDHSKSLFEMIEEAEIKSETEAYLAAIQSNNFPLAESIVKEALQRRPNSDELQYRLAYIYRRTNRQEQAVVILRDLYVKKFGGHDVLLEFADALRGTKAYKEAALVFNELLESGNKQQAELYVAAAMTFSALNDKERQRAIVAEGLRHYPQSQKLKVLLSESALD